MSDTDAIGLALVILCGGMWPIAFLIGLTHAAVGDVRGWWRRRLPPKAEAR